MQQRKTILLVEELESYLKNVPAIIPFFFFFFYLGCHNCRYQRSWSRRLQNVIKYTSSSVFVLCPLASQQELTVELERKKGKKLKWYTVHWRFVKQTLKFPPFIQEQYLLSCTTFVRLLLSKLAASAVVVSNTFCIPLQYCTRSSICYVCSVRLVCVHITVIERLPPGDIGTSEWGYFEVVVVGFFETKTKAEAASNSPASEGEASLAPLQAPLALLLLLFCSL